MPKISKQTIEAAAVPEKGDFYIWDTELPGFGVRIQASGRKTFIVRYRTRDRKNQRKVTLCRCADAPPDKARAMAREVFQTVATGGDPAMDRKPVKVETVNTLEAMFQARIAYMRAKGTTNATEVERVLLLSEDNAADALGRQEAPADITPSDIIEYVSMFYQRGARGAADKARSYLSAAFNWAILSANDYTVEHRKDWGLTHNPVASVAKDHGAAKARDRNLSVDELRDFWRSCSDRDVGITLGTSVCLKLLMACGQRVQETLRIEGKDVDLANRVWRMPAQKTKGRKTAHTIPLPDIIIPDLAKLVEMHGTGPLFPAVHDSSVSGMLSPLGVAHAVRRYTKLREVEPFQTRDLRRTWKSRTHDAGIDRFMRDMIQQHAKNDTGSKHYDRAEYYPQMREAMDKWDKWLTALVAPDAPKLRLVA